MISDSVLSVSELCDDEEEEEEDSDSVLSESEL